MSTSGFVGISTMKPCCRILVSYTSSSLFGVYVSPPKLNNSFMNTNLSKLRSKSVGYSRRFCCYSGVSDRSRIIGNKCVANSNRRVFSLNGSSFGQSGVGRCRRRGVLVIPKVSSDIRNHSTSVDAHVNEKGFERIYIQGGLNVKPLVIEKIEEGNNNVVNEERSNRIEVNWAGIDLDYLRRLNDIAPEVEREVSEVEKEAWKLLRDAVVNYCGNPVGTVAANDPGDKQPLNYDQVFIRDFIPSALAFLLNGETEIVKNFLLHTMQLQVHFE